MRRPTERVERVAECQRRRVDDMERTPVKPFLVRDVVDCLCDKVDRNKVERPTLRADERHPLRERVAHLLDELERVVRPVDAIRLPGLGRSDDHTGPVHAPGYRRLRAHDALQLVLGLVIRMIELLPLVEHRFGEGALEPPRHGDGTHQVKAARTNFVGKADDVPCAGHVGALGLVSRRGEVVHGGEVEELCPAQLLAIVDGERESWLRQVPRERMEPLATRIETLALRRETSPGPVTDQHEDVVTTGQEQRHQVAADESRGSRDEVRHAADNSFL